MEQEVFIYHSKERHPETGYRATVAARWDKKNKILYTGISLCSPEDQFVKRLGRHKAVGRTYSKKDLGTYYDEDEKTEDRKLIEEFILYYLKKTAEFSEATECPTKISLSHIMDKFTKRKTNEWKKVDFKE